MRPGVPYSLCLSISLCVQRLAGGPDLPKQMAEMDRELRALQQQVRPLLSTQQSPHTGSLASSSGVSRAAPRGFGCSNVQAQHNSCQSELAQKASAII